MTIPVENVANYFLHRSTPYTDTGITPLKLQKLVYYGHSWYMLLNNGEPLIDEEFQAWVHGPVCPSLYRMYKHFGYGTIPIPDSVLPVDQNVQEVLDIVWNMYGSFDGRYLEELTHQEVPWIMARGDADHQQPLDAVINNELIYQYYQERLLGAET
ncbi:Panacea domain-containing protein [Peribacillus frigoritolerans]|uniref:Panacea domain-containing protein n=1 Tax=Peribacillus frigoritolerans TaxID=450367 RepID=UPI00216388C1|nr:type II toxin-antitoxin system antitoxin SocA domain-containing protein [Peribacillus frigoritolerans]